jgi:cephalosporin hydroxylase
MPDAAEAYFRWFYDTGVWKHMHYRGARLLKSPSDLWNYQEIISALDVQWVVETGTWHGGSALFFADLLQARGARGKVITVDIDHSARRVADHEKIEFVYGSSVDPDVVARIRSMLPPDRGRVFLILDSDHSRDHVYQELLAYVPLLVGGDYLVVEDTSVNGHPVLPEHGPGPWEALDDFLVAEPHALVNDVERERKFGFTVAPRGYFVKT